MVEIAKRVRWQLTVIVFDGESVSPVCLLGELHFRVALLHESQSTQLQRQRWEYGTACTAVPFVHVRC